MRLIYHFGYPRTGTTLLQKTLFPFHSEINYLGPKSYDDKYEVLINQKKIDELENFYSEFESYTFCKKSENKLGVKIEASGSPKFCTKYNKVIFRNECRCKKNCYDISSTLIRSLRQIKLKKKNN